MEILPVEPTELIENKEIVLPVEFEEPVKPDVISEIEEVLIKEETLKPTPKKKRFRPSNKVLSNLSLKAFNEHCFRRDKKQNASRDTLISILLSNPDYLAFDTNYYALDFHPHYANTIVQQRNIYFDKNLNVLTPIRTHAKILIKDRNFYPAYLNEANDNPFSIRTTFVNYVVINMKKLILSRGEQFRIVYKTGISYKSILDLRRYLREQIKNVYNTAEKLKRVVSTVYDEDTYDIIVNNSDEYNDKINFKIAVKFDHITIRNSIENERYLGTFVVYLNGVYKSYNQGYRLYASLNGIRTTFTVEDILTNYHHSHLPKNKGEQLERFCTGSEDGIFSGLKNPGNLGHEDDDIQIQSVLLSLPDYLSWESLEGGPYYPMDDVNMIKNQVDFINIRIIPNNNYCGPNTLKNLIDIIIQNPEYLKDAFVLAKSGKGYEFTCNKPAFYELVGEKLKAYDYKAKCLFNSTDEKFYLQEAKQSGNLDSMIKSAEDKITNYIPAYINGKFIYPEIILKDQIQDPFQSMLPIEHPAEMMKIADVICKLLNDELNKDEYRKRK